MWDLKLNDDTHMDEVNHLKTLLENIAAEFSECTPELVDMSGLNERWRNRRNTQIPVAVSDQRKIAQKNGRKSTGVSMLSSRTTKIHQRGWRRGPSGYFDQ